MGVVVVVVGGGVGFAVRCAYRTEERAPEDCFFAPSSTCISG